MTIQLGSQALPPPLPAGERSLLSTGRPSAPSMEGGVSPRVGPTFIAFRPLPLGTEFTPQKTGSYEQL